MAEPNSQTIDNLDDKGYKTIFKNKEMFLEFLQSFVKEEWVNRIDESDMIRVDKEFVLQDYRKKEADIIYKLKLKDIETGEKKEIIFYVLLELQSSVDRLMPYRLLMYMVQIWKEELKNIKYTEAQKKNFKLPAIVPIVMHNSGQKWNVSRNFKDMLNETKSFGNHLVDFEYILIDVNSYSEQELTNLANAISIIVMLDQKIVAKDREVFQKRFNKIIEMKHKFSAEKFQLIIEWLQEVFRKRFSEDIEGNIMEIIKELKEGENMTYAIEKLFDNIEKKGMEKGIEKGDMGAREQIVKEMLLDGESITKIKKYSKLSDEEIAKIKNKVMPN
jgi:hypothetical protein